MAEQRGYVRKLNMEFHTVKQIIIPTRNEERYIFNTVRGLQDLRKEKLCEIILVDGMSVDKTVNIATQYVDKIIKNSYD